MQETAVLVNATDPELVEEIKEGARKLKEQVYGKRIVLFAPLYVGNLCVNNCEYCGFRATNKDQKRTTLTQSGTDQGGGDAGGYGTEKTDPGVWRTSQIQC